MWVGCELLHTAFCQRVSESDTSGSWVSHPCIISETAGRYQLPAHCHHSIALEREGGRERVEESKRNTEEESEMRVRQRDREREREREREKKESVKPEEIGYQGLSAPREESNH